MKRSATILITAPLRVSNSNLVTGLNSQYLSGMTAPQLATGGDGFTAAGTNTPLSGSAWTAVAGTGALPAGTYYVTATAFLIIATADSDGLCAITKGSDPTGLLALSGGTGAGTGFASVTTTLPVSVTAGDTLQWKCLVEGNNGSVANSAGITAIRVLSSNGTAPLSAGRPITALPGGLAPQGR